MIQKRLVKVGLAKQTAKGSGATNATYAAGVRAGSAIKVAVKENDLGMTWSNRSVQGFDRSAVEPGNSWELVATPSLIGLLLLGTLGTDVVTGAGPYTHTMTSAVDLPYLTAFGTMASADWAKVVDSKVAALELSWGDAGKLVAKADLVGCTPSLLAAAYTETNQELMASVGFLAAAGGIFNVEGAAAQIQSGSVKLENKTAGVPVAATVTPADVVPAEWNVTWSLKIVPNDTGLFREVVFGSGSAGALSSVAVSPHLGSIETKFIGPSGSSLDLTSPACQFAVDFPAADSNGGPAEVTLAGKASQPVSGADFTAVLINTVASY